MIRPTRAAEQALWDRGLQFVAGVDEVGRGAWAGPVVAGAAILPRDMVLPDLLRDSKLLSPTQRLAVVESLKTEARAWSVGRAEVAEINTLGIVRATFMAMSRALEDLKVAPEFVLIDGFAHPDLPLDQQQSIIKGDATVAAIAAASIIAKVYRDALLTHLDTLYPGYGLAQHKGYGTRQHHEALQRFGATPVHRTSFRLPN